MGLIVILIMSMFQLPLALLFLLPLIIEKRKRYATNIEEKDKYITSVKANKIYDKMIHFWTVGDISDLLFILIPFVGWIVVLAIKSAMPCDSDYIFLEQEIYRNQRKFKIVEAFNILPNELSLRKEAVLEKILKLGKEPHAKVIKESHVALNDILLNAFVGDYISEKSIRLIHEAYNDLEILLDKLADVQNKKKEKSYQEHLNSIDTTFFNYRELIQSISKDLQSGKVIF